MRVIILANPSKRQSPKAGDERFLKGRQVVQIRQQVKMAIPGGGGRKAYLYSNGRPVWEWVDKGSVEDRTARHSLKITGCSDPHMWYAGLVGQVVELLRVESDCYMSREPAGYTNIVLFKDAEVVPFVPKAKSPNGL